LEPKITHNNEVKAAADSGRSRLLGFPSCIDCIEYVTQKALSSSLPRDASSVLPTFMPN
jgi:hypothetical protein